MQVGNEVVYKGTVYKIAALNYPEMILVSLDGEETVKVFGGYGVTLKN